jgi:hypothetical protein
MRDELIELIKIKSNKQKQERTKEIKLRGRRVKEIVHRKRGQSGEATYIERRVRMNG